MIFYMDNNRILTKVPQITIYFWIVKILTTAMGESTSDYFVSALNPVVAIAIGLIGLIVALVLQFRARKYIAWIYWFTVIMIAIFGTMAADVLHVVIGIPYIVSTSFFAVALCIIFGVWYASEKTLSIHSITTTRRETFYWLTIFTTFALGTAAGDLTATTFGFGYFYSGVLFVAFIALVAIGHYIVKSILGMEHRHQSRNAVFTFWLAYILTRPLGASFADWMGKPQSSGGLGWGDGTVSMILLILIVGFVGYLSVSKKDVSRN